MFRTEKAISCDLAEHRHGSPLLLNLFAGYRKEAVSLERR